MTEEQGPMESTHRYPPRQGVPGERPLVPETTEKAKGGIRLSKKGGKHLLLATQLISTSNNYFLQLSLFRTVLETHRQPLTPTPPQSHRKNLLPKRMHVYERLMLPVLCWGPRGSRRAYLEAFKLTVWRET